MKEAGSSHPCSVRRSGSDRCLVLRVRSRLSRHPPWSPYSRTFWSLQAASEIGSRSRASYSAFWDKARLYRACPRRYSPSCAIQRGVWDVNEAALIAFVHNTPESREENGRAPTASEGREWGEGFGSEPRPSRGSLLMELYPDQVTPSDVWDYFFVPVDQQSLGRYCVFWRRALGKQCTDSQVAEHLDALAVRAATVLPFLLQQPYAKRPAGGPTGPRSRGIRRAIGNEAVVRLAWRRSRVADE